MGRGRGGGLNGAELEARELLVVFIIGEGVEAGNDVFGVLGRPRQDVLGPVQFEARLGLGADLAERREDGLDARMGENLVGRGGCALVPVQSGTRLGMHTWSTISWS